MNLRSLINFNDSLNTAIGINVHTLDASGLSISYCVIKSENDVLSIVDQQVRFDSVERLHQKLSHLSEGTVRVHVNFSGKGILIKPLEGNVRSFDSGVVHKLFPFIHKDDLVSQMYTRTSSGFLAVTRKDLLVLLEKLNALGYSCCSFSMGPFILDCISSLLKESQLSIAGYKIDLRHHEIISVSTIEGIYTESDSIQVGDQMIVAEGLLAYAAACTLFIPTASVTTSILVVTEKAKELFKFRSQLYTVAKTVMLATLITLIVNTAVFFWLQSEIDRLESRVSLISGKSEEEQVLQSRLEKLVSSYEHLGWKSNLLPLYYADQVAQTVPFEIQLTGLEIGVMDEVKIRQERLITFQTDLIKVKGLSANPLALYEWTKKIERLDWVLNISDQQYQFDPRKQKGLFELKVYIK